MARTLSISRAGIATNEAGVVVGQVIALPCGGLAWAYDGTYIRTDGKRTMGFELSTRYACRVYWEM